MLRPGALASGCSDAADAASRPHVVAMAVAFILRPVDATARCVGAALLAAVSKGSLPVQCAHLLSPQTLGALAALVDSDELPGGVASAAPFASVALAHVVVCFGAGGSSGDGAVVGGGEEEEEAAAGLAGVAPGTLPQASVLFVRLAHGLATARSVSQCLFASLSYSGRVSFFCDVASRVYAASLWFVWSAR